MEKSSEWRSLKANCADHCFQTPRCNRVFKVKSHGTPADAKDPFDLWTILGKRPRRQIAKEGMCSQVNRNQCSTTRYKEYDQHIRDAILCSECLHEVSKMVFRERKPIERGQRRDVVEVDDTPAVEVRYVSLSLPRAAPPHSNAWDPKWLQLVVHYFSMLTWPDPDQQPQATPVPTALLELMLDCFISFQILPPVNLRLQKKRQTAQQTLHWSKFHTQYFAFSRAENAIFPKPYLTDGSYIWIRTLDFLKPFPPVPGSSLSFRYPESLWIWQ